jgi:RHS repeat-associated protein
VSEVLYYHRDMQGSVVATTYRTGGWNGYMGARYRYTPYGQLDRVENVSALSDSELGYNGGLRLGYTAGVAQQGNLLLLGARVYHAELKRWLVPDTVDARRYTYVGGDPVNFVDPSGRVAIVVGGMRFTNRGLAQMYYDLFYGDSGSVSSWNLMVGGIASDARINKSINDLINLRIQGEIDALREALRIVMTRGATAWISLMDGAHGFGHMGIGATQGDTVGQYPLEPTSPVTLVRGKDVPGEVKKDDPAKNPELDGLALPMTSDQVALVSDLLDGALRKDQYNLYAIGNTENCAVFVLETLRAVGIAIPHDPYEYMPRVAYDNIRVFGVNVQNSIGRLLR